MRRLLRAAVVVALACLTGCAPVPLHSSLAAQWVPSPNHDPRRANYVVLHHTGSPTVSQAIGALTSVRAAVSAHYVIDRDGTIVALVDERERAWHAGDSYWGGHTDLNSASIGVELVNDGEEPFADTQIASLVALLQDVSRRHRFPPANVLGHGDVAPTRKVDPSLQFPWSRLAQAGFGAWCEPTEWQHAGTGASQAPARALADNDDVRAITLLQAFGYDAADPQAALRAFHRHFRGSDAIDLEPDDLLVLECLVRHKTEGR